jgi:hypothetical protein
VICVDEFGPLNLMPCKGKAWRPAKSPRRLRATYNRRPGVLHMLAALRYFALNGTDHTATPNRTPPSPPTSAGATPGPSPKTGFAADSPIRTWTHYPAKAA